MSKILRIFLAFVLVALLSGCGGGRQDGEIVLTIKTFGQFGYEELYKEYEATHPNITIKEDNIAQLDNYSRKLQQWLAAGRGAGDIVALEESVLVKFMVAADQFVNLLDHGAGSLEPHFLEWKWQQALTPDGTTLVGLGTDVGAQAMCYRRDLFLEAGLPVDRDEVSRLWPTWVDYLAVGKKFVAGDTGAKFFDSAGGIYENILIQQGDHTYFDKKNRLVIEENRSVKTAWDITTEMVEAGLSANLQLWGPQWNAGFKKGTFATVPCPAWMLGHIASQAGPENAGVWDVAEVPGRGGVRGGSFLAVPLQSEHPAEAVELAKFLTSPRGQVAAFKAKTNFPSSPEAIDDPVVANFVNPYFNNAPVGKIFGESAKALKPVYLGPKNREVSDRVGDALTAVEQGRLTPDQAWIKAVRDAERVAT